MFFVGLGLLDYRGSGVVVPDFNDDSVAVSEHTEIPAKAPTWT
jgi:hypothetical protein